MKQLLDEKWGDLMFDFEYHLKNLPDNPGVYLMRNSLREVIYVGK